MAGFGAVRAVTEMDSARLLYDRIGRFLLDQRLDLDPANYAFAYHLLADPHSPLARAVAMLTDGGMQLTQHDIEKLGSGLHPVSGQDAAEKANGLVARTQMQVEDFADMVHAMRVETNDFGRDLAASADRIRRTRAIDGNVGALEDVSRITAAMLERIVLAESRLESVTREAIELRAKLEEARDNARRDPLTNLPNRRAFEEAFSAHMAAGTQVCIAICDVDRFKTINDRFGHAVGDRVLRAIGDALAQTCEGHMVARYGGEEFAILFADYELDAACATLDRARVTVAARRYRLRESDHPLGEVTFSAGLTMASTNEGYAGTFHRADSLLYRAKREGRNRIHMG